MQLTYLHSIIVSCIQHQHITFGKAYMKEKNRFLIVSALCKFCRTNLWHKMKKKTNVCFHCIEAITQKFSWHLTILSSIWSDSMQCFLCLFISTSFTLFPQMANMKHVNTLIIVTSFTLAFSNPSRFVGLHLYLSVHYKHVYVIRNMKLSLNGILRVEKPN